jgi:hypothetical protein
VVSCEEFLSTVRTERTVIDRAPNLKQQVGAAPRPSHLLTFVHPAVHQEIGCPFGDRGTNSQPGTVAFGVIHQPRTLAGQIPVQRPRGRPKLSRRRDRSPVVPLTSEMMHNRPDTIDAFPRVLRFSIPDPPVQSLDLGYDHRLRGRARRINRNQPAGDLFEMLEFHCNMKPVEYRRFQDASSGENAPESRATIGERRQHGVLGPINGNAMAS